MREYWQNLVTDRVQRSITFARGPWDFDGFSQLYFDEARQADHAFRSSEIAAELVADEHQFLGELNIITAVQTVVLGNLESVVNLDAELPHRAFQLRWPSSSCTVLRLSPHAVRAHTSEGKRGFTLQLPLRRLTMTTCIGGRRTNQCSADR